MRRSHTLSICLFALCASHAGAQCPIPGFQCEQWAGNGHWYFVVPNGGPISWGAANALASSPPAPFPGGGYLATITSQAEQDFLCALAKADPSAWEPTGFQHGPWLGGIQANGAPTPDAGWSWVTGEPWSYTEWDAGEPNRAGLEDRLHIHGFNTTNPACGWNDIGESNPVVVGFLVELECDSATEGCCFSDGTCQDLNPFCCLTDGGTPQGGGSACGGTEACCDASDASCYMADRACCLANGDTPQGPGSACTTEACCFTDNTCQDLDPECCSNLGGTPQGSGSTCGGVEACCDATTGACYMADRACCEANGDTPHGAGSVCTAPESCCFSDGSCQEFDPLCCESMGGASTGGACTQPEACCLGGNSCTFLDPECCAEMGGLPLGPNALCECAHSDGCCLAGCNNNNDDDCDPVCGNGALEMGEVCDDGNNADEDGCSADCSYLSSSVPTVSNWSMIILVVVLLIGVGIYNRRRRSA